MKTILKVYSNLYRAREAMERDAAEVNKSGKDFRLLAMEGILEVTNLCKVFYKVANGQCDHLRGFTVNEIYIDDKVDSKLKGNIFEVVKVLNEDVSLSENNEFYYVVEDKIGEITRILRTNDKSLVETLFRENR